MAKQQAELERDDSLHSDFALENVPMEKRKGLYELLAVWVGWAVSISAFLVGGVVGAGLTPGQGILAVLVANVILVILGTLVGLIGFRTGLTTYSISRRVFGKGGSVIVSLALGIVAMGYIGVILDSLASSFDGLVPGAPKLVVVVIFAALVTLSAIYGFKGLATLSKIAAPLLWLLMAVALIAVILKVGSFGGVFAAVPKTPITFMAGMGAAVATWVTGAALASDITRYAKRASHVFWGAVGGYILGAFLMEAVSVYTAAGVGNANVVAVMGTLGLLLPAVIVLIIAVWTTADNNIYSSGLAFTNAGTLVGLKLSKPVWTVISILIAVLVSLLGLAANFLVWLTFISIAVAPFAGVILAHFWLVHRGQGIGDETPAVHWIAIVSWLVGSAFAYFYKGWVPALPALIVAGLVYWGLSAFERNRPVSATTSSNG